jgi:hypothetical protein
LIEASTAERLAADYARARQIITTAYDSAERAYRTHGAGVFATNTAAADLAALEARYREIGERLGVAIPGR